MVVALDTLVKQLEGSGIVDAGALKEFVPPRASPKDADELVRELIKSRHLTRFQAQEVSQGRVETLLLGSYTILDEIGAGGMGRVFKAHHRRMDRVVALKVLPPSTTKEEAAAARFEREARAAARLNHPNIVTAYDADQADGVHFLVMEYIEGNDLSALVKKHGPLAPDKAIDCVLQAARGLAYAHQQGVIHRDIKPSNLLLDRAGVVKILDLGLARIEPGSNAPTQAELTGMSTIMGTVDYMAPEQALSTKHADGRADIYSLGCTFYYLLAGKAMYDGETQVAKVVAHRDEPIPKLRDVQPGIPKQLEAVFRKMVAKNLVDRFQTMSDVVVHLERCEALLKQAAESEPRPAKGGSGVRGKWWLAVAAAGMLVAIVLAAGIYKLQTQDGTLIVEVDQPDAMVEVLDEQGKVVIRRPSGQGTISIEVDPGKHRLKVVKDGFQFFAKDFEMQAGGKTTIAARLARATIEPLVGPIKPVVLPKPVNNSEPPSALPGDNSDRAVALWVLSLGGSVEVIASGLTNAQPQSIAASAKLPTGEIRVRGLDLRRCTDLTDADLDRLLDLQELTSLTCGANVPTDEGLVHVGKLTPLESLNFPGGPSISDRGLQSLVNLPKLQSLHLSSRVVSSRDAIVLASLPALAKLYAYGITGDEALPPLTASKSLTSLTLGPASGITNEGLRTVGTWEQLTLLAFSSQHVTDAGLPHLAGLKRLKTLTLQAAKVTPEGVASLRQLLPDCTVEAISTGQSGGPNP